MSLLHHDRTDDEGDAHDEAANGNEGHVAGAMGSPMGAIGDFLKPDVVKRAEALMDKLEPVIAKLDSVLDDVKLVSAEVVKVLGMKK